MSEGTEIKVVSVIVIKDSVVDSFVCFPDTREGNACAEMLFRERMSEQLSNFDEYTEEDIQACLDEGYAIYGHGSICIAHNEET